ncbi:MAG: AAA family ATPase [Rubrivivax sp.]
MTRISLLGPPRLSGGERWHDLAGSDALLIALLALDGALPRRRAAELLWPGRDARRASLSLRQRLFRLKRAAGADVVIGDATLALAPAVVHDLAGFDAALQADAGHGRGELLAGVSPVPGSDIAQWLVQARSRWADRVQAALAERAEALLAAQQLAAALRYAERLAAEAPWAEHAHRRVMRLHYLRGDRAAALAAYRRCEQALARELDAAPAAETRALAALLQDDAAPPPAPAAAPAPPPLTLLRPPQLVGREAALQRIAAAWQARRHVLVSGEPGIGKSRLLAEHAARCRPGSQVLLIESRPGDAQLPYGIVARLLRGWLQHGGRPAADWAVQEWARFVPELGVPAPGAATTARLQAALAAWAAHAAAAGADAVIVDDLQFADAASLDALLALLAAPLPQRWLLAVRAAERPAALQAWLASPAGDATEELPLAALDTDAVAELLRSLALPGLEAAPWADALWRHAGGNPFYTLQTLLACGPAAAAGAPPAALPVPGHLGQLVQRRLQQLQAPALQLAQIAALAEADFSVPLAARVLQRHAVALAPAWAELEAAQVLRDSAFAHDLVREAVAATVPEVIARELHLQIADALAEGGVVGGVPPARLARHLAQGGRWDRAAAAYLAAADQALAAGLRREEAQALDAALHCLAQAADRQARFRVLERRCRTARYVDAYAEQLRLAGELQALAEGAAETADAELARAAALAEGQQWHEALPLIESALRRLAADDVRPMTRQRRAAALLAQCRMGLGDAEGAIRAMQAGIGDAMEAGDGEAARYLIDLAILLGKADRPREAWPLLQRAARAAGAAHDWGLASQAHVYLGWVLGNRARARRAIPYYERGRELHARTGVPMSLPVANFIGLARLYREVGRYGESLALLEAIVAAQGGVGEFPMRTVGLMDLAVLFLELGQPARALQLLGSGRTPPADAYAPSWLMPRSRIEAWAGRPAADLLQAAFELVRHDGQRLLRWVVARDLALVLPPDEGEALARAEAADCAAVDCPHALWGLRLAQCDRLLALGRAAEAAPIARAALTRFAGGVPPGIYPPRAWLIMQRTLAAAGDGAAAAEAHRQGRRWLHDGALPNVPPAFRESFLHRNPFNPAFGRP